jgi:hypothetical protein
MSVPSQPPNPPNWSGAPGESRSRPPAHDAASNSPADPQDEPHDFGVPAKPEEDEPPQSVDAPMPRTPRLGQPPRGKRLARKTDGPALNLTAEQRLLLLDTWRRSGLPAGDFAALVGLSKHSQRKGPRPG